MGFSSKNFVIALLLAICSSPSKALRKALNDILWLSRQSSTGGWSRELRDAFRLLLRPSDDPRDDPRDCERACDFESFPLLGCESPDEDVKLELEDIEERSSPVDWGR